MSFKLTKVNSLPGENISVVTDNIPESHLSCENCAYARQRSVIDVL